MRLSSQLINGISRVLQKLLSYFNGTIISTPSVTSLPVSLINFCLSLNELVIALATLKLTISPLASFSPCSSPQYCHKLPDVFE